MLGDCGQGAEQARGVELAMLSSRPLIPHMCRCLMNSMEQRIAELHHELSMLRIALEFLHEPPARERIYARINTCIEEYTQLVDWRLSDVIPQGEAHPTEG
jgi:hypothetical protein